MYLQSPPVGNNMNDLNQENSTQLCTCKQLLPYSVYLSIMLKCYYISRVFCSFKYYGFSNVIMSKAKWAFAYWWNQEISERQRVVSFLLSISLDAKPFCLLMVGNYSSYTPPILREHNSHQKGLHAGQ
jgi:hypothetical protein